ncbi:hypothetical protein ASF03_05915 [Rhizobium sp. Leaf68]|nr:hypothetical protein ASE62_05805 [Rhizobium sp. Leaf202]KQN85234.1 hypothetical protein ASF03_05915 [Rhizobium sp. Leaf68]
MTKGPARGSRAGLFLSPLILASWYPLNVLEKLGRPVIKGENLSVVILGLDPRIHVFQLLNDGEVDPRVKPEDDGRRGSASHQQRAEGYLSTS